MRWYEKLNLGCDADAGADADADAKVTRIALPILRIVELKMLDSVTFSCQKMGAMIVNKYFKFQSNISNRLGIK